MPKILFVTPSFAPFLSGAQAFQQAMAQRLMADGYAVTVLTTDARRPADFWQPQAAGQRLNVRDELNGVVIERLRIAYPLPAPLTFGAFRRAGHWLHRSGLARGVSLPALRWFSRRTPPLPGLSSALARLAPEADLIQAVDSSWDGLFTAAADAAGRQGKPFVAVPLMHLGDAGVRAHFQMAHQVEAYRRADAIFGLSERELAAYAGLGVASERLHLIAMGVEPVLPAGLRPRDADLIRQELRVDGPLVAFIGANTYDKGALTLARAAAELNLGGQPVDVVYAGAESEALKALLDTRPVMEQDTLHRRVHLLGTVDELVKHRLLAACDLLALPSQVDTFGIVLLEAWLHGKPVIGAAAGGIPELVQDGQTGLLVPFDNVPALAAAIRRLVVDPELAARLGAAGREEVFQRYTWSRTYQTLLRTYADCLGRSQIPA